MLHIIIIAASMFLPIVTMNTECTKRKVVGLDPLHETEDRYAVTVCPKSNIFKQ